MQNEKQRNVCAVVLGLVWFLFSNSAGLSRSEGLKKQSSLSGILSCSARDYRSPEDRQAGSAGLVWKEVGSDGGRDESLLRICVCSRSGSSQQIYNIGILTGLLLKGRRSLRFRGHHLP